MNAIPYPIAFQFLGSHWCLREMWNICITFCSRNGWKASWNLIICWTSQVSGGVRQGTWLKLGHVSGCSIVWYHLLQLPSIKCYEYFANVRFGKGQLAFSKFVLFFWLGDWGFHGLLLCVWVQVSFFWGHLSHSYTLKTAICNSLLFITV